MADDTEADLATEVPEVMDEPESSASDVVASNELSQAQNSQNNGQSDAPTPAAIRKRAIEGDDTDEGENEDENDGLEENPRPRKRARKAPASGTMVEQDTPKSAVGGKDDLEGESIRSTSANGKDSTSSPSVSSKDFDRAGWSARHHDAYADLTAQARTSKEATDESSQQAAPSQAVAGLRTSLANPAASVPAGLRTSFGATPTQAQTNPGDIRFKMHNPLTDDERNQLVAAVRDQGSRTMQPYSKRKLKWTVSPLQVEYLEGNTWLEVWETTVDKWCEAFVSENQANIAEVGLATAWLKGAFEGRLRDSRKELPQTFLEISEDMLKFPDSSRMRNFSGPVKPNLARQAKKKARKEEEARLAEEAELTSKSTRKGRKEREEEKARLAQEAELTSNSFTPINAKEHLTGNQAVDPAPSANEPTSGGAEETGDADTENIQHRNEMEDGEIYSADASGVEMEMDEDDQPTADANVDMDNVTDGVALSEAELEQRHRYFPGIPDDAIFCLTCGHIGHQTDKCPELICKFCQGPHFKYECLMRQRCGKCKQLGHTKASCSEKLAVAPGEAVVECAICEGHDHTEIDCLELYQIYKPHPDNIKKVKHIPAFCYICGIEGHYGGDCSMADYSIAPTKMWTMATASLYIDNNSDDIAVSLRNPLPPPADDSRPNIPGRSIKPQTHEFYVEDDDDGDGDGPNHNKGAKRSFLGNHKFNKPPPKTAPKIQISSNLTFGGNPGQSTSNSQHQAQRSQVQLPKRLKGPAQPPKKKQKPGNDALPGTKPSRPKPTKQQQQQQPPSNSSRGGGGGGRGRGGGFSALNTNNPRGSRRRGQRGGRGGGGQN